MAIRHFGLWSRVVDVRFPQETASGPARASIAYNTEGAQTKASTVQRVMQDHGIPL